jgi:c-di-GMP-binding flagellar brake protein YcgR
MTSELGPMDNEGLNGDRRKFQRLKINISIAYQVDKHSGVRVVIEDEEVDATTLDLSVEGMAVLTEYDIPILAMLSIEFMVYKIDERNNFKFYKSIKVSGHVRSNLLLEDNTHRIGIYFTKIDAESKAEIAAFVKARIDPCNPDIPFGQTN